MAARRRFRVDQSGARRFEEVASVGEIRERVVQCVMFAIGDLLVEFIDESSVLDRDGRVTRKVPEKVCVVVVER